MKTIIYNVRFAGDSEPSRQVMIDGDKIVVADNAVFVNNLTSKDFENAEIIDGDGALMLPGAIDCHVHFREPGLTHKADIASESRAALAGGVTSYMDMPNTKPATTSIAEWEAKMALAADRSVGNYAFFIGATDDNLDQLTAADYARVPGVKLFMGSSTGNMLVDDVEAIARIFRDVDAIIAVHAEDQTIIQEMTDRYGSGKDTPIELHSQIRNAEACYQASKRAVELARQYNRRLHICHITTKAELSLLSYERVGNKLITSEVSPHHLLWCADDYAAKGARIKMNPSVKSAADRAALREALRSGLIDMVATDHAPHLLSEKEGGALKAVSGAPLVQFSLPLMLTLMGDEQLVQRTMCENPALIYHIDKRGFIRPGNYADLVLLRPTDPYTVFDSDAISKCGWTPLDGVQLGWRVEKVWVNGTLSYDNGQFINKPTAMPLKFNQLANSHKQ